MAIRNCVVWRRVRSIKLQPGDRTLLATKLQDGQFITAGIRLRC